jgi:hypothetical protein
LFLVQHYTMQHIVLSRGKYLDSDDTRFSMIARCSILHTGRAPLGGSEAEVLL